MQTQADCTTSFVEKDIKFATKEEIRSIQIKALETLKYFDLFCQKYSLSYCLCGGALIGAVREGRLIEWDDDIDVFMIREDYEKLSDIWSKYADTDQFVLCRSNKETNFRHTDTAIVNRKTSFICRHSSDLDVPHGIALDIIPLDGLAPTVLGRFAQKTNAIIYSLFNAERLPDNQGKLARYIAKIIYSIVFSKSLRYKLWSHAEKKMIKYPAKEALYLTELVTGLNYLWMKYPKENFCETINMTFEGQNVCIPKGYKEYLSAAFGDYMTPPPKEKQVPKHSTVYFDASVPYENYRGIYFSKGDEK